ncbi:MAG: hypothetical protein IPK19_17800 [Chloroflexi bacterium]|nr:hypothetical protein [Chloroflexota bacterium]
MPDQVCALERHHLVENGVEEHADENHDLVLEEDRQQQQQPRAADKGDGDAVQCGQPDFGALEVRPHGITSGLGQRLVIDGRNEEGFRGFRLSWSGGAPGRKKIEREDLSYSTPLSSKSARMCTKIRTYP